MSVERDPRRLGLVVAGSLSKGLEARLDAEVSVEDLAEEAQYLAILKNAHTVKDTVEVTDKLSEVRGEIEQLTGELKYLSQQIEMSVVTVTRIRLS